MIVNADHEQLKQWN